MPDLATSIPTPTNGGKTWVFKLRKGIKFSNGKTVTATDVVASFSASSRSKSPTSGTFYAGIVGRGGVPQDAGDLHARRAA